ncbi:MAG: hypothetical protein KDI06_19640 [Calditrichaeota bacterium]|nr:hypothetical protein [Calditrichota bacterium]
MSLKNRLTEINMMALPELRVVMETLRHQTSFAKSSKKNNNTSDPVGRSVLPKNVDIKRYNVGVEGSQQAIDSGSRVKRVFRPHHHSRFTEAVSVACSGWCCHRTLTIIVNAPEKHKIKMQRFQKFLLS